MAKRKKAIPVSLTPVQRHELERLWFIYGNYGPKTTKGNHSFIQGLLERGEDERPLRIKGYTPTPDCELAVDAVLARTSDGDEHRIGAEGGGRRGLLRLITSQQSEQTLPPPDPNLKALLDDLKARRPKNSPVRPGANGERSADQEDAPDAA